MAIKRPTKSRGTPSHKPIASAPLRHVDVKAPQQMVPGELYAGWLCKNRPCGLVIAIAVAAPGGKALTDFDDQLTAIKCPHCGESVSLERPERVEIHSENCGNLSWGRPSG
jgi:predicted RNA-binding Zn-ribbon protein involved in translation (DUF1610 family)